jgi:hypothetical protein
MRMEKLYHSIKEESLNPPYAMVFAEGKSLGSLPVPFHPLTISLTQIFQVYAFISAG